MEFKLVVHPEIGPRKTYTGNHRILITTQQTSIVIVLGTHTFEKILSFGDRDNTATAIAEKALQSYSLPINAKQLAEMIVTECRKCASLYAGSPLRGYNNFRILS